MMLDVVLYRDDDDDARASSFVHGASRGARSNPLAR
jgi:hypothetical protein